MHITLELFKYLLSDDKIAFILKSLKILSFSIHRKTSIRHFLFLNIILVVHENINKSFLT